MPTPPFDYWPLFNRPRLEWPDGARLAFWVGINVEHYEMGRPAVGISPPTAALQPDPANQGWREYGPRVGIWRLMELLDKYHLRASVLLNSDVCHHYPQIIAEGNKRNWVWLGHGKNNAHKWNNIPYDEERAALADALDTIRRSTGRQVKGWLGPALTETENTPDLLAEQGLTYTCNWVCDDQPYPLKVKQGRLISVPYSTEANDLPLFVGQTVTGQMFYEIVRDQFDVLYEQAQRTGLVLGLGLHPFIVGRPYRLKYLEQVLEHITQHDGVWLTTSDEIADWYYEHHYDRAVQSIQQS